MSALGAHRGLLGASAVVFAASAITTVLWCGSMAAMPGMPWMRMPGQSWLAAAATFIGMWSVMMVAMMLPVLVPILSRYREARVRTLVGAGYFAAWTLCGAIVFPVGLALAEIAMRVPAVSRAMPIATGVVMLIAGILQFTAWKRRQLACCRVSAVRVSPAKASAAWRHGLQLGHNCVRCCASLTAVLLAIGVMDLRAMAAVTALITAERLAPAGERVARGIGVVVVVCGLIQLAKVTGL